MSHHSLARGVAPLLRFGVALGSAPGGVGQPPSAPGRAAAGALARSCDKLRKEFEAIRALRRDSRRSRLERVRSRRDAHGGAGSSAPTAAPAPAPPPPAGRPARRAGRSPGPAGCAGAAARRARFRSTATRARCRRSSTPTSPSSATSWARRGRTTVNPPRAGARRSRGHVPGRRRSLCARRLLSRVRPRGVEIEEGFLDPHLAARWPARQGRQAQAAGRQGEHAPRASLPWVDKPLMIQNLLGGDEGLADAGISVSKLILNPWMFLEATGEVYQGRLAPVHVHKPSDVSWVGRLRGYRDVTESTNVDVGASVAYGTTTRAPISPRGSSGSTRRSGIVRCVAPSIAGSRGARSCSGAAAARKAATATPSACMRAASTSSRGAGSAAPATTGPSAPTTPRSSIKGPSLR